MTDASSYFLYHSIGQYPGKADQMAAALTDFATIWSAEDDDQWPRSLAARHEFIDLWTTLIDAPAGSLTAAENVTTALFSVIGGLPAHYLQGKRVLIAADCFPSLHFLLAGLADRFGFTLDTVPLRQGECWVRDEDMIDRWGADVGLAILTYVTSTASHRSDLAALTAHGRAMGSLIGVDLTQGIGILPYSVATDTPDFVISTSLKWLCGTPGAGIIQMRPDLITECSPELRGWLSQDNPFQWDLNTFSYAPDARRFQNGTPSILPCIGSVPGLRWLAGQDGAALLDHTQHLTGQLQDAASDFGLTLASPSDPDQRGGSLMVQLPANTDANQLVETLRHQGIFVDNRGQTLRMSPGYITTQDDVTRLINALSDLI